MPDTTNPSVALCRKNGWGVGTVLERAEGDPGMVTITYISDSIVVALWHCDGCEGAIDLAWRAGRWREVRPVPQEPQLDKPKTVECRIALVVDADGHWGAGGGADCDEPESWEVARRGMSCDDIPEDYHWVTVEVPIPQVREVAGTVEEVGYE